MVRSKSSGAVQSRCPPRIFQSDSLDFPLCSATTLKTFFPFNGRKEIILGPTSSVIISSTESLESLRFLFQPPKGAYSAAMTMQFDVSDQFWMLLQLGHQSFDRMQCLR